MKTRDFNKKKENAELVTDQPGFAIFIIGVSISLVFGILLRGFFSSEKIRNHIALAASQIHKNVKVEFEDVKLSLSKNGIPRVAVIISNISAVSEDICLMSPQVKINEIVLPISMKNLFSGKAAIEKIMMGNVQLLLNGELKNCRELQFENENSKFSNSQQKTVSLVGVGQSLPSQLSTDLKELSIDEFKVFHNKTNDIPFILTDVAILLKSIQPKIVLLKAQSYFFNENQKVDYSSRAELNLEYNEFPEKKLQTHIFGQFREGHFTIQMQNRVDEGQYNVEIDLRHLPLSKIFSTLQRYGISSEMNPKQVWLSLKGKSQGFIDKIKSESFDIKELKLEGDIGEVYTDLIEFSQLYPLKVKPFLLNAEQLDLSKALAFYSKTSISPMLGDMGRFTGRIEVFDMDEVRLFGFLRGLEFVFSGVGSRELQRINQVSLDTNLKRKRWSLKLNRFEVEQGKFNGDIALTADRDFQKIDVKVKLDELLLSPKVQNLVTRGGYINSFNGNLNFSWENASLNKIVGHVRSEEAVINSIKFEDLNFNFEQGKDYPFVMKTKFQNIIIPEGTVKDMFLRQAINANWIVNGNLNLNKITGQMGFKADKSSEWRGFNASLTGGNEKIFTEGKWNAEGVLTGAFQIKSTQSGLKYNIRGTRDEPILEGNHDPINVRVEPTSN